MSDCPDCKRPSMTEHDLSPCEDDENFADLAAHSIVKQSEAEAERDALKAEVERLRERAELGEALAANGIVKVSALQDAAKTVRDRLATAIRQHPRPGSPAEQWVKEMRDVLNNALREGGAS